MVRAIQHQEGPQLVVRLPGLWVSSGRDSNEVASRCWKILEMPVEVTRSESRENEDPGSDVGGEGQQPAWNGCSHQKGTRFGTAIGSFFNLWLQVYPCIIYTLWASCGRGQGREEVGNGVWHSHKDMNHQNNAKYTIGENNIDKRVSKQVEEEI